MSSAEALALIRADVPERLDAEVFAALERLLADQDAASALRAQTVLGGENPA
jgi:HD-GYP domain-containing protein (c-di-GMP phosphodiesterase class II)